MAPSAKIARQAYRRARQSMLVAFAENVLTRTQGATVYQAIQATVDPLAPLIDTYRTALAAAHNRGRSEVVAKDLAHLALLQQLDKVADAVDRLAQGNLQTIVDAGFTAQQTSSVRYDGKLPTPVIVRATSTGRRGEVRIVVDDFVPARAVVSHAVEYAFTRDGGWQNGDYHTHRNFVAEGLPHAPELWLRLKSLGRGKNRSEWSEPVAVAVL